MKKYTRYLLTLCLGIHHACASDQVWVPLKYENDSSDVKYCWIKATKGQELAQIKLVLQEITQYQFNDHRKGNPVYHNIELIKSGTYDEGNYEHNEAEGRWDRKDEGSLESFYDVIPYEIQHGHDDEVKKALGYDQGDRATVDPDGSKLKQYLMQYIDDHITPDTMPVRGYTDKELEDYFDSEPSGKLKGNALTQGWIEKLKIFSLWGIYDEDWPVKYEVGMERDTDTNNPYYEDNRLQDQKWLIQKEQNSFKDLKASQNCKLNTPTDIISYMDEETGTKTQPSNDQTGGLNQNGEPNDPGNRDPSDGSYTKFIIIGGGIVVLLLVGKYYTDKHSDKAPTKRKKKKA